MRSAHIHHITYSTTNYEGSARDLGKSAAAFGLRTRVYTPRHPAVKALASSYPDIMAQARGAGYWLWKPAVLLDALNSVPEGDIVFYTDASMSFVRDPIALTLRAAEETPSVLFEHIPHKSGPFTFLHMEWTKRDCFVLMDADSPAYWGVVQVIAGIQIHRNCPRSRSFVAEWLAAAGDDRLLTDRPNTMGLNNLEGFVEHRHDQSILTTLAVKHGIPRHPDPTVDLPERLKVLEIHRRPYPYLESFAFYRTWKRFRQALRPRTRGRALAKWLRDRQI